MKSIKELKNLKGKKVLLRVDFNVPIKNGKAGPKGHSVGRVEDDFRIKKSVPTILYLLSKGANVHILMHLGDDGSADISPVINHFFRITKFPKDRITFSENIRKFVGEMNNDKILARNLSLGFDLYVNEAFSVSHREHASIVGIPKFLPSYAGLQFLAEIKNLNICLEKTKHPFLFILGGAKFSTKMPLIKKFMNLADHVFIGGALFNDVLKEQGFEVGESLVDESVSISKNILKNKKILLPVDVLVKNNGKFINKNVGEIEKGDSIVDAGYKTTNLLKEQIKKVKFVLWNGPLGKYEDGGDKSTREILKTIANTKLTSIIGGGDTVELVNELKLENKFTFVSTGGGATLEFLSKGTLVGIDALNY